MQVLHGLGGIPLRQAYSVIKAISKKKMKVIDAARADFIAGAAERGVAERQATDLFELILKFAGYGFNKSHSTGYAIVAYQTAYLKTYFPKFYMASVLTFESQAKKPEEWAIYLEDCRRMLLPDSTAEVPNAGFEVLPPDVNLSAEDFSVVFADGVRPSHLAGDVRFGLQAIKGIAKDAIASIVEARAEGGTFTSIHDFCERIDHARVNQKAIELLVRAGALDSVHGTDARAAMLAAVPDAYKAGRSLSADRSAGQNMLFGGGDDAAAASAGGGTHLPLPEVKPWDQLTRLAEEKETLGFFVSGHPLDGLASTIAEFCTATTNRLADMSEGASVILAGVVNRVRPVVTKTGNKMAMSTLTDKHGTVEAVVFSEAFAKYGGDLQVDRIVAVVGTLEKGRGEPQIVVDQVIPAERLPSLLGTRLDILFDESRPDDRDGVDHRMRFVSGHLRQASRSVAALSGRPVETAVHLRLRDGRTVVLASPGIRVVPDDDLLKRLRDAGADGVRVRGGYIPPRKEDRRRRFAKASGGGGGDDD